MVHRRVAYLLPLLFIAGQAYGQICPPGAPTRASVRGRVIAPGADFSRYHEVVQLDENRQVGFGYTGSDGEYRMPPQENGYYYINLRIDGFKEYKEKVDVKTCDGVFYHFIYMVREDEEIPPVIVDFTGEVDEVVDITELARSLPREAVQEFERARSERLSGERDRAQKRLEKLVLQYPDFYEARNALGSVYLEMKRFRDAEAQYNEARTLRPNSAAPWMSLGSLYVQEAEAALAAEPRTARDAFPGDLAVILYDARMVLLEAIRIKPDASFAYYLLGITYLHAQDYLRSEENFRKALEVESRLRWARLALANLYIRQGRLREAVAEFDAYLAEFKNVSNRSEVEKARAEIVALLDKQSK